ncbi:DUF2946 family protein [Henriciella sp.]|uniref:DUF2946 family protein n=1 Tax=Henriciella sp. TaxID=1968823 RepID=UPI00263A25BA|nr:DUF2946 family protein [Henriciella sp.]
MHLRALLVIVIAAAFLIAPVSASAELAHAADKEAAICADAQGNAEDPAETPDHEGHAHTSHHCGTCHVHIMGGGFLPASLDIATSHKRHAFVNAVPMGLAPDGLYRPPRA